MPYVQHKEIMDILHEITGGKEISFKVRSAYTANLRIDLEKCRNFDKSYSVDGLTVHLAARLGKKGDFPFSYSGNQIVVVTPDEKRVYEEKIEAKKNKLLKKTKRSKGLIDVTAGLLETEGFEYGESYVEGPLVKRAGDAEFETAEFEGGLAEYIGLDLNEFCSPEWKRFIESIVKRYGVEIGEPSNGHREKPKRYATGVMMLPDQHPRDKEQRVFRMEPDPEGSFLSFLSSKAEAVYYAGSTLKKARDKEAQALSARYLE